MWAKGYHVFKAQAGGFEASLYPNGGLVFYHFLGEYGQLIPSHLSIFFGRTFNC